MAKPNIVIDASVLGYAGEPGDLGDACVETLQRAIRIFAVVLDFEGFIESEYDRRIKEKPRDSFVSRWWIKLISQVGSRRLVSGTISQRDEARLRRVRFDTADFTYVAVAKRAGKALLVHEDSDYCNAEDVIVGIATCRCIHPPIFIQELDAGNLPAL
jgi:hypothetical protein